MERLQTARAVVEAREQAEILLEALRRGAEPEGEFLVAHAQQLLACCREIAALGFGCSSR